MQKNKISQPKPQIQSSPEKSIQIQNQQPSDSSPKKEQKVDKESKRQILLKESGIFEAYEYLLKQLIIYGLPKENLFEFASLQVLKYEKHLKNKILQVKINQPKENNNSSDIQSSLKQVEQVKINLEQQNYLKQLEEIKKNLEMQTQLQKQQIIQKESNIKDEKLNKGKNLVSEKSSIRNKANLRSYDKNISIKQSQEKSKNQERQKVYAPSQQPQTFMKSPRSEIIRKKNQQYSLQAISLKDVQKIQQISIQPGKYDQQLPKVPQASIKQHYARGRKT